MHSALLIRSDKATPIMLVGSADFPDWLQEQAPRVRALAEAVAFRGEAGRVVLVPDEAGGIGQVLLGVGEARDGFALAHLPGSLPPGDYGLVETPASLDGGTLALGWADGAYRFTRYKKSEEKLRRLVLPADIDAEDVSRQAEAIDLLRDLVNTPACDMGPVEIAGAAQTIAEAFGARIEIVTGAALESGYPMVHAVGMAAVQAPRFIEISWRKPGGRADAPKVAIVGKGVAFDTGGLNIKTSGMAMMKKDMGGAAHALALARLVMGAGLDVALTVAVPAVENAIGSKAFRPSDILASRKGLTVEIDNTDAEGRLILADALTRVSELEPELVIDFATLTGAARVALGTDIAPFYTDDDTLAAQIEAAARAVEDPCWRMPLWAGYDGMLSSPVADLKNATDTSNGGSITAALFLKRFVTAPSWVHFDIWAWRLARHGRPAGAAACGLRAVWTMLKARYGAAPGQAGTRSDVGGDGKTRL
ncbi:MAG: leucyl aminopeptidase family protein [Alphaproteobacteria bacterium]|nr:leucyl aminopeptidase family protein [Alphaproteobacteria bacterium]